MPVDNENKLYIFDSEINLSLIPTITDNNEGKQGESEMKPKKNEVTLYGFIVPTEEIFDALMHFEKQVSELIEKHKPAAINRPFGQEILLYYTPEERNEAYTALHEYFPNAKVIANPAFVKKKYLNMGEKDE